MLHEKRGLRPVSVSVPKRFMQLWVLDLAAPLVSRRRYHHPKVYVGSNLSAGVAHAQP